MQIRRHALLAATLVAIVAGCVSAERIPVPSASDPGLPGEAFDLGPKSGANLSVVGLSHEDNLNVRKIPDGAVIGKLAPLADEVVATGRARSLPGQIWYEIKLDDETGWVSSKFLGYPGQTSEETSKSAWALEGKPPTANIRKLGRQVLKSFAVGPGSEGGPSKIRIARAPTETEPHSITYDVIGVGDDSILGYRIRIETKPNPINGGLSLERVRVTTLCSRGVNRSGLCS